MILEFFAITAKYISRFLSAINIGLDIMKFNKNEGNCVAKSVII